MRVLRAFRIPPVISGIVFSTSTVAGNQEDVFKVQSGQGGKKAIFIKRGLHQEALGYS